MDNAIRSRSLTGVEGFAAESPGGNSMLETIKHSVADQLSAAAGVVQKNVRQTRDSPASAYAARASAWLDGAADYIREIEPEKVKTDIQNQIRSNPGRTLIVAGAAGLLLGLLVRRR